MARIREFAPVVQVGIRSMSRRRRSDLLDRERMFFAHELYHDKTNIQEGN